MNPKKPTKLQQISQLTNKVRELEAQALYRQAGAYNTIHKAGADNLVGSACVISISFLGGKEVCETFAVADGLSAETIAALKSDIKRSIDLTINHPANYLKETGHGQH